MDTWECLYRIIFLLFFLLSAFNVRNSNFRFHLYEVKWFDSPIIFTIAAKESSTRSPNSSPLVGSVWCLSTVVLVYLYTSVLISYLTIPKMRPIVETTEDLAASTRLHVVAIKNSIFESTLLVIWFYLEKLNPQNFQFQFSKVPRGHYGLWEISFVSIPTTVYPVNITT